MRKPTVRIDKWLWAARFFKTRTLAGEMVRGGHIEINGERAKPSRPVQVGDNVRIQQQQELFVVTVTGVAEKRGSATIAQTLYQEREESITAREKQQQLRKLHAATAPSPERRPDKKARRQIIRFQRRED